MARQPESERQATEQEYKAESMYSAGKGRKDVTGYTNVYPASGPVWPPSGTAILHPLGTWGQADRGPEGYYDSGESEIIPDSLWEERKALWAEAKREHPSSGGGTPREEQTPPQPPEESGLQAQEVRALLPHYHSR